MEATLSEVDTRSKAGKYLTFRLAAEEYGLEILKVQEIIQMQAITRIPRTPGRRWCSCTAARRSCVAARTP